VLAGSRIEAGSQSLDEIAVTEQPAQSGFSIEASNEFSRVREVIREQLDDHTRARGDVVTEKDAAHPAFTDTAKKAIPGDFPKLIVSGMSRS
jgi:hypothetical protein